MVFRDDDEAARARADALQVDLDATQKKLEETEDKLADAEDAKRKLEEAEERLAETEAELAKARRAARANAPPGKARSAFQPPPIAAASGGEPAERDTPGAMILIGAILFVGAIAGLVALVTNRQHAAAPPPNPDCTLQTQPPGAQIVALCHDSVGEQMDRNIAASLADAGYPDPDVMGSSSSFEMVRGTTPLTKPRQEWIMESVICHGGLVARLPGYADTPVSDPLAGMGCSDEVVQLTPD